MKILIEESVLRQALDALFSMIVEGKSNSFEAQDAITALRTALDDAEKVEPLDLCQIYREMKGIPHPRTRCAGGNEMTDIVEHLRDLKLDVAANEIERLRKERDDALKAYLETSKLFSEYRAKIDALEPVAWVDWDYTGDSEGTTFPFTTNEGCGIPVFDLRGLK